MNFIISKSSLNSALSIMAHAINSTSPQPTLRCILMEVEQSSITLYSSDADVSIKHVVNASEENRLYVVEPGSCLIEARYLIDIVKNIDSHDIQLEIIDGQLVKFSGNSAVFKINGLNPADYPVIDLTEPSNSFTVNTVTLSEIIDQTTVACDIKGSKPILTGLNFRLKDKVLTCIATDSFRLSKKTLPLNIEGYFNVTLPLKSLKDVQATMLQGEDSTIKVSLDNRKVQFIKDDLIFQSKILEGAFPETSRLIPTTFEKELLIDRNDFISAIYRTTFIKTDNNVYDRLQASTDEIILTNSNLQIGESREQLTGQFTGEPIDISFTAKYVLDAAKVIPADTIRIRFNGNMKPFVFQAPDDESLIQLIVPIRTYN